MEVIERIGLAVLLTTDPDNTSQTTTISMPLAELYLLRECCQSFVKINTEPVGYNLLRKIYTVILERALQDRLTFDKLTEDIEMNQVVENTISDKLEKNE